MKRAVGINPIACDGSGLCAELLPERITLDDWGYPIVDSRPLTPQLEVAPLGAGGRGPRRRMAAAAGRRQDDQ